MKVYFSATARFSLADIGWYIAQDNPGRARSFVLELQSKALEIADMPMAYPLYATHPEWGIRCRVHGSYAIYYRVGDERIEIVDIIHCARNVERLLL
jgi:toxin ParE1/3/4